MKPEIFTPAQPHVAVALVLGGIFGQFADPLDWIARQFELDTRVNRQQLMESLADRSGGVADATFARGEAGSLDERTRFSIELFGRCEGRLVALCRMSLLPRRYTARQLEEHATDSVVLNDKIVLGIQATNGASSTTLDGLTHASPLIRLLPVNVFNRAFFRAKLELIENDKKLKMLDAGTAAVVELVKPWLFYDVPKSARAARRAIGLLPF